jgi:hypothetical protein
MKRTFLLLAALLLPTMAQAEPAAPAPAPVTVSPVEARSTSSAVPPSVVSRATEGFLSVKQCVMQNNPAYCRTIMTPNSYELFDRFVSYKLMPCLPTDFNYAGEQRKGNVTIVKATMPASNKTHYIFSMVFVDNKVDIPESFHVGLGENWQNKIQLADQLYQMMRQNLGDKLTCDQLNDLIKK